jgi:hypothetical protein
MTEHEYLMSIETYFGGEKRFQVTAANKTEAVEKAKETQFYRSDNTIPDTLKCIRKLKPSFGKDGAEDD